MRTLISQNTLPHIRHHLAAALPGVKSAHLAEALAGGLGYASNAALRANSRLFESDPAIAMQVNPEALITKLTTLGYDVSLASYPATYLSVQSGLEQCGCLETGSALFAGDSADLVPHSLKDADWATMSVPDRARAMVHELAIWLENSTFTTFIEEEADLGGNDFHLLIAECFRQKRFFDPMASDFLVTAIVNAQLEGEFTPQSWHNHIYEAFRSRMLNFMDAVCRTWNPSLDPLSLRKSTTVPKQRGRWTVSSTPMHRSGIISPSSTGNPSCDMPDMVGMFGMALFLTGVDVPELERQMHSVYLADDIVSACLALVPTIGTREGYQSLYAIDENPLPFSAASYARHKLKVVRMAMSIS